MADPPLAQVIVEMLNNAARESNIGLAAAVEGATPTVISDADRWQLVFRSIEAITEACTRLAAEVDLVVTAVEALRDRE